MTSDNYRRIAQSPRSLVDTGAYLWCMKYRKKPVVIEALTFDEFKDYAQSVEGKDGNTAWSFSYEGHPITHENDECYIIPTLEGHMNFTPNDMLITGLKGEIYPCKVDIFLMGFESVDQ